MATMRKRGNKWHVQIRRKGCHSLTRSFSTKADAHLWARQVEAEADRQGLPPDRRSLEKLTLGALLTRYRDEIVPTKRGRSNETIALNALLRHKLAGLPLASLTASHVAAYRDERLKSVKGTTLNRQLDIFRHALEVARTEWGLPISPNPFSEISRPRLTAPRERRLGPGEWDRLKAACARCRRPYLSLMVELAVETSMRRGELLRLRWADVRLPERTLYIPTSKNGHARTIPLTGRAIAILSQLEAKWGANAHVLPMSLAAMKSAWKRTVRRAGLDDFHFHDLRHEAISRFFERGLSVPEVALISGHRDPRMLFRYTHPRAELIALKLAGSDAKAS